MGPMGQGIQGALTLSFPWTSLFEVKVSGGLGAMRASNTVEVPM